MPHEPTIADATATTAVTGATPGPSSQDVALVDQHLATVHDHLLRLGRSSTRAREWAGVAFASGAADLVGLLRAAHAVARPVLAAEGRPRHVDAVVARAELATVDDRRRPEGLPAAEAAAEAGTVWEAATTLDPTAFAMLDLHLRHGLTSRQVADALGLDSGDGWVLLGRAQERASEAITTHQVLRRGTRQCQDLEATVLAAPSGSTHGELLALVRTHVATCAACTAIAEDVAPGLDVFAALALAALPPGLREDVLTRRAAPPAEAPSAGGRRRVLVAIVLAVLAAAVVGSMLGGGALTTSLGGPDPVAGDRDRGHQDPDPSADGGDDHRGTAAAPTEPGAAATDPDADEPADGGRSAVPDAADDGHGADGTANADDAAPGGGPDDSPAGTDGRPAVEVTRPLGSSEVVALDADDLGPYAVVDLTAHDRDDRDDELSWRWSSDAQDGTLLNEASGSTRLYTRPCATTVHQITVTAFDAAGHGDQDLVRVAVTHEC